MSTVLRGKDSMTHFSLLEGQARAVLIDSTRMCVVAKRTHHLSPTASIALGRLLTATAIMGDMLKSERASITMTVKGGGPLGALVSVGMPGGIVKGYADDPFYDDEDLCVGRAVGRDGLLTVVRDSGMREPYCGQTQLVSGEIAEDICQYLAVSEQIPSLLSLGVHIGDNKGITCAGGLLVQMMPGASEAAIQSVEMSAGMFSDVVSEIDKWGPEEAARQLLSHLQPVELERTTPEYRCDCSRERVEKALITLGEAELRDMIATQHGATAGCHFCNRKHRFTEEDLEEIIRKMKQ